MQICNQKFSEQGRFRELLRIISSKTQAKKLYNYTNILIGKSNRKIDTIWAFLSRIRPFFRISKNSRGGLPPSPPKLQTCECGWMCIIFLNNPKYSWKCLHNVLCHNSEYSWWSYMFDKLLKMPRVLNVSEFWIWHGSIWKGYTEFWIYLNMAQCASEIPEYASICLNVPEFTWTWLKMPE